MTLRMRPETLNETVRVLTDVLELVLEDAAKRFTGHGFANFFYVIDPRYAGEPSLEKAMDAWSQHPAVPQPELTNEFSYLLGIKKQWLLQHPESDLRMDLFWPPVLKAHAASVPLAARLLSTAICLSWENASVERDLSILQKVCQNAPLLGDMRRDHKTRVRIQGAEEAKVCSERCSGFVRVLAAKFFKKKMRRDRAASKRGVQGPMPQRACAVLAAWLFTAFRWN